MDIYQQSVLADKLQNYHKKSFRYGLQTNQYLALHQLPAVNADDEVLKNCAQ
jgi:hypothetical protein